MGHPDWTKIPFEKMPEWKQQEILGKSKKVIKDVDVPIGNDLVCGICGKLCKSKLGLTSHKKTHSSILN